MLSFKINERVHLLLILLTLDLIKSEHETREKFSKLTEELTQEKFSMLLNLKRFAHL